MRSTDFAIAVNGKPVDVAHAAANYSFVSFDITGPVTVEITAAEGGFWDRGVDIQPWRLGLRPKRQGQTIEFKLNGPAKLSIARPGDFLNRATMLFLFAGAPPAPPPPVSPSLHYYQPGVYHQSLNPKSGDTYYLAPGSYFFGSLNLWKRFKGSRSWAAAPSSTMARRIPTPTRAGCRSRTGTVLARLKRITFKSPGSPASSGPVPGRFR
jgi:hypothetical protein